MMHFFPAIAFTIQYADNAVTVPVSNTRAKASVMQICALQHQKNIDFALVAAFFL